MKTGLALYLTEEEATWLRAIMQNKLSEDECVEDTTMRSRFYIALGGEVKGTTVLKPYSERTGVGPPPHLSEPPFDPTDDIPF